MKEMKQVLVHNFFRKIKKRNYKKDPTDWVWRVNKRSAAHKQTVQTRTSTNDPSRMYLTS